VNGYHPISDYLRALNAEGTYVVAGGSMAQLFQAASNRKKVSKTGGQIIVVLSLVQNQKDLILIKEFLESGKIIPVIDGCYPLINTPEAFWYFEKVHPKGKVVITMEENRKT
jgi:D-arabinose 1-dehydrogenase-like Zn-dependent alcohol dehydrogenase